MEKKLFKEPKQRLKDGRYCSDEQKRIEMSIDRCKLLEMQLQTERRKVIALTERNVMIEKKYKELILKLKELVGLADVSGSLHYDEKLLIDLWYKRNPCNELNKNSGKDMFWKTAFMVFEDYIRVVSRNDR